MIASIVSRPIPDRPLVSSQHLPDVRLETSSEKSVDLTEHRGQTVALTVEGVIEMTNIDPGNAARLLELGVLGGHLSQVADIIEFDPAHTRGDIYLDWARSEPKPIELRDFDRIMEVRGLLHLPAETPHPRHFVEGAFEFLKDHGCATFEEAKQLLHSSMAKDDPTKGMFADISGAKQKRAATTATLKMLRAKLPAPVRTIAGTALERPDTEESIFAAPPPEVVGDLTRFSSIRAVAAVHVLRLAARVVNPVYLQRVLLGLREIDERIETTKNAAGLPVERAAELVLRELMKTSVSETREGRKAGVLLNTWSGMIEDLRIPIAQLKDEDEKILRWPSTVCPDQFAANRTRRHLHAKKSRGASRLRTSSGLADALPQVIQGMDARYREIENLRGRGQDARVELGKDHELASVPIVQETAELDGQGSPTGALAIHRYRLWKTESLLKSIIEARKKSPQHMSLLWRVSKGRFPKTITPTILIYEGSSGNPPWFQQMFAAGLFNTTRVLPLKVRQRRYELIRDMGLPAHVTQRRDLLTFDRSDATAARTLLCEGVVAIPIEEFAIAMQLAHTAFSIALVTAARVGEICQIRIDGSNFGYDQDHGLAYWTAQPKQQTDAMDPEPLTRNYHVDEQTLAAVVSLKQTMTELLGPDRAARPARPSQNMKKLGNGPWLFRSEESMLDPGVIKAFLHYLSAGIANFGIHDVRAAIAKYRNDQGDSMDEIRSLLGHGGVWATEGYARPTEKMVARKREDRRALSQPQRRLARLDEIRRRMA